MNILWHFTLVPEPFDVCMQYRIWQFRDRAHYASSIVWLNDMLVCNGECDTDTGYRAPKPTFSNFSHIIIRQNASYLLRGTHRAKGKKGHQCQRKAIEKLKRCYSLLLWSAICYNSIRDAIATPCTYACNRISFADEK